MGRLQNLRAVVSQLEKAYPDACAVVESDESLSSGIDDLDALIGGGFRLGTISGVAAHGGGAASIVRSLVMASTRAGHRVALVDSTATLQTDRWCVVGNDALWRVRPPADDNLRQSLWAAEMLTRSNAFRLVVIDLGSALWGAGRASQDSASERRWSMLLRQGCRRAKVAVVVSGPDPTPLSGAPVLEVMPGALTDWRTGRRGCRLRNPRNARTEVAWFDVGAHVFASRLPSHHPLPDRRPRARRPRRDGFGGRGLQGQRESS